MVARNLLHKDKLEGFKSWLTAKGREHRPGRGNWQVLQVRHGTGWQAIFERAEMPEHLSVPGPLIPLVQAYIREGRALAIGGTAQALDTLRGSATDLTEASLEHLCEEVKGQRLSISPTYAVVPPLDDTPPWE